MTTIIDPKSGVTSLVKPCQVCHAPIYFGYTAKGKRCPYDVVDGQPTEVSHFTSCARLSDWKQRS